MCDVHKGGSNQGATTELTGKCPRYLNMKRGLEALI